jgi:hypothetical protein
MSRASFARLARERESATQWRGNGVYRFFVVFCTFAAGLTALAAGAGATAAAGVRAAACVRGAAAEAAGAVRGGMSVVRMAASAGKRGLRSRDARLAKRCLSDYWLVSLSLPTCPVSKPTIALCRHSNAGRHLTLLGGFESQPICALSRRLAPLCASLYELAHQPSKKGGVAWRCLHTFPLSLGSERTRHLLATALVASAHPSITSLSRSTTYRRTCFVVPPSLSILIPSSSSQPRFDLFSQSTAPRSIYRLL